MANWINYREGTGLRCRFATKATAAVSWGAWIAEAAYSGTSLVRGALNHRHCPMWKAFNLTWPSRSCGSGDLGLIEGTGRSSGVVRVGSCSLAYSRFLPQRRGACALRPPSADPCHRREMPRGHA